MYLNSKQIIEEAIPATLAAGNLRILVRLDAGKRFRNNEGEVFDLINAFQGVADKHMKGHSHQKEQQLERRLGRAVVPIAEYMDKEKMQVLKRMILTCHWIVAPHNAGGINVPDDSPYCQAVLRCLDTFDKGPDHMEGYYKVEESAKKQVQKIHKMCQEMGYY